MVCSFEKKKFRATSLVGSVRIIIYHETVLFLLQKLPKSPENSTENELFSGSL